MTAEGQPVIEPQINPALAGVMVECPWPGQEELGPQAMAEFAKTEVGQRVLEKIYERAGSLQQQRGISEEEAVVEALGIAVVRDDSGDIVRSPDYPEQPVGEDPTAIEHENSTEKSVGENKRQSSVADSDQSNKNKDVNQVAAEPRVKNKLTSPQPNTDNLPVTYTTAPEAVVRREHESVELSASEHPDGMDTSPTSFQDAPTSEDNASTTTDGPQAKPVSIEVARTQVERAHLPTVETEVKPVAEYVPDAVQIVKAEPIPKVLIEARRAVSESLKEIVDGQFELPSFEYEGETVGSIIEISNQIGEQPTELIEEEKSTVAVLEKPVDVNHEYTGIPDTVIEPYLPKPTGIITEQITENLEIGSLQQEQTETFVGSLPENLQITMAEFVVSTHPEEAEAVEMLVVDIAVAADRLKKLVMSDEYDIVSEKRAEEIVAIESLITLWYQELAEQLDFVLEPETVQQLLTKIKSEDYKKPDIEDNTHETRPGVVSLISSDVKVTADVHRWLGNNVVRRYG